MQNQESESMAFGLDLTFVVVVAVSVIILCFVFVLICKRCLGTKHDFLEFSDESSEDHLVYIKPPLPPAPGLPEPPYYFKRSPQNPRSSRLGNLLTDSLVSLDGPKRDPRRIVRAHSEGDFETGYGGAQTLYSDSESLLDFGYGGGQIDVGWIQDADSQVEPRYEELHHQPRKLSRLLQRSMSAATGLDSNRYKREPGARRFGAPNFVKNFPRDTESTPSDPLVLNQDWFKLSPDDDEYINEGGGPLSMSFI